MKSRYLLALLAAGAAFSVSCVHQTRVSRTAAPTSAPISNWDRQVRNAIDAGDGDFPLRALRQKVAADPDNVAVRLELAKAYGERGYHEVSLEISRLAVARFPQSGEAQLSLVRGLRDVNRRSEAIASVESFLKVHPESGAEFYSWLGILRDESGLWPLGEPAHRNAPAEAVANWQATSDPATAHNNLAAVWMEKGNYSEARRELDLALGYNRAHAAALRNLELVARLDGNPAALKAKPLDTRVARWQRFRVGVRRLFVGPLDDSRKEAPQSASTH